MLRNPEFDNLARDFGIHLDGAVDYLPPEFKRDFGMAMDAQPGLVTTPSAGIPAFLTTMIDPQVIKVSVAPSKAAQILGEVKRGSWLDQTIMFSLVERTGEVSSYGDWNNNGRAGLNATFPQRQAYLYQVIIEYGELEMERAGLLRLSWVAELQEAAALVLNKFQNLTYFFGVNGLQNYGLVNDPSLPAALTPATKAATGTKWVVNGVLNATANEIYADIQSLFIQLVTQTAGLVEATDRLILAMSPAASIALTATNSFGINVYDLLKKNFPNIRFETAIQYGALTTANPQGVAAGNLVQLIAEKVDGVDSGFCAFNEKLRTHAIVRDLSSFKQKTTQGTWGAIIRFPLAFAQMIGV